MGRVVELANSNNWENVYDYSVTAEIDNDYPIPLPPVTLPIFLESDIIAVYVNTAIPSGKRWKWGGSVEQIFNGLTIGNITSNGEPRNLWINKLTTIFFPSITAQYSLRVAIPRWFYNFYLEVYRYRGIDDTDERILMLEEFANINFKLDDIRGRL
jgi:hypothetical protein